MTHGISDPHQGKIARSPDPAGDPDAKTQAGTHNFPEDCQIRYVLAHRNEKAVAGLIALNI